MARFTATGRHDARRSSARARQHGFTYLGVLFAVAIIGASFAAVGEAWDLIQRRDKEQELLFVGHQFRKAIGRYYTGSPAAANRLPRELSDLIKDPRFPDTRRYLRKIYYDPITNSRDWGLVKAPDGGIIGVYSQSDRAPLKTANFRPEDADFEEKPRYSDWRFVFRAGPAAPPAPQQSVPKPK